MEKDKQIHIRVSETEKTIMEKNMTRLGFRQLSEYIRYTALNDKQNDKLNEELCLLFALYCRNQGSMSDTRLIYYLSAFFNMSFDDASEMFNNVFSKFSLALSKGDD